MKISCCWMYAIGTYGFPPKVHDMLKAIKEMAELGFNYIELEGVGYDNLGSVIENKELIKAECEKQGVEVVNFAPLIPEIISLDKNERKKALRHFEKGVEAAKYFGSPRVWIDSYNPPLQMVEGNIYVEDLTYGKTIWGRVPKGFSWHRFWDLFVGVIKECNDICKQNEMELLIEPRVGEVTGNTEGLLRLFDAVSDDNLGAILDTAHQYAQKEILPLSIAKLGSKIRYVHVADNDGRDNHHYGIGNGTVDWEGVFLALKEEGYQGFYAIDLEKVPNLGAEFIRNKQILEQFAERYDL
ncbi:MAG: sugar phosphate isomerase/epimerase [Firmicutes bacterium]|nr:sugar phosphate isomerase/epimerase [Bacillota bacterium]